MLSEIGEHFTIKKLESQIYFNELIHLTHQFIVG